MKQRLDKALLERRLVKTRSQAENYVRLGLVKVNEGVVTKPGYMVAAADKLAVEGEQYVSRAALKLASIADLFDLDFQGKTVLDVGSSTGGFTDYALQRGAEKVICVDVGTNQLHPSLRVNNRVKLHEKTDIRDFKTSTYIDVVVADVSFISLTKILPSVAKLIARNSLLIIMCKPQFEAGKNQINKGVIKNSAIRRAILKNFEQWLKGNGFVILNKSDSQVAGTKGNVERFYKLQLQA